MISGKRRQRKIPKFQRNRGFINLIKLTLRELQMCIYQG
nr:MAG TPA: hypothetical protein [Caudoviricetes sp.]